jgi:transcriptional regulator with XRE-family HTH domain
MNRDNGLRDAKLRKRRAGAEDIEIGRKIRALRLERGLSQSGLADGIDLTFQQVQKYEKGVNRVGAGRLVRVAEALGVPVMTLLDGIPGVGRRTEVPAVLALIAHAQPLRLVHAFAAIDDKAVRRSLMMLAEGIARRAQSRRAVRKG